MQYRLELPLPGGNRPSVITLENGAGTLTNPYAPETMCPLYDVDVTDAHMAFKAMVGRTEYIFSGPAVQNGYSLTFTTLETIPLEPGKRLCGVSGELAGEYLVGVYSPGGVKENHFVIEQTPQGYTGEMYGLVDQKTLDFMEQMMQGGGPGGPGGPPPGAPPMEPMPKPRLGDKSDVNIFTSVTGDAEGFTVSTVTGMGSEFRFTGSVNGDSIQMMLHVTDVSQGVLAVPV